MMNPHPFEFVDEVEHIRLRSELYDIERTIHMGRMLVVETTGVNWPWLDNSGTPQSEAVTFVERFTVSEDQTRLDYHLTVTDAATFTEPAIYERYWLALAGATIQTYDCQVL